MKINDTDISVWNARQWNVTIEHNEIKNESEWVRGSPVPVLFQSDIGMKKIKINLLVKGESRNEIEIKRSNIVALLLEPVHLTLDGFGHKFHVILDKTSITESSKRRFHLLTLEFYGYEYDDEITVSFSGVTEFSVVNPGNLETPLILEVTPAIGASSVTFNGMCRNPDTKANDSLVIHELTSDSKIIIDGENGLMTENERNKFKNIDLWELPTLLPGENKITCDNKNITATIKFKPRFI